jgi:hypothetical protein
MSKVVDDRETVTRLFPDERENAPNPRPFHAGPRGSVPGVAARFPKDLTDEELRPYYNEWMRRLMARKK